MRTHWTTAELMALFGVNRRRISALARSRAIDPIGAAPGRNNRGRQSLWPADADVTLRPDPEKSRAWRKANGCG